MNFLNMNFYIVDNSGVKKVSVISNLNRSYGIKIGDILVVKSNLVKSKSKILRSSILNMLVLSLNNKHVLFKRNEGILVDNKLNPLSNITYNKGYYLYNIIINKIKLLLLKR